MFNVAPDCSKMVVIPLGVSPVSKNSNLSFTTRICAKFSHPAEHRLTEFLFQRFHRMAPLSQKMLIVLVTLHSNTRQSGIRRNILRFSKEPVSCREPILEQSNQINLGAGCRSCWRKIHIVNMDIPFLMGTCVFWVHYTHHIKML